MRNELRNYEIFPKIVPSGRLARITIRPLGRQAAFAADAVYRAVILPMDESREQFPVTDQNSLYPALHISPDPDGNLVFEYAFSGEQEHIIRLFRQPESRQAVESFRVFSLLPDLFARRPYRGDFHVHTFHSDGKEAPEVVAANYRRDGFDFLAITDHHRYAPSKEAIHAWQYRPVDLRLFTGEEVHPPGNHIHIVNFGSDFSVNDLIKADPQRYEDEVAQLMAAHTVPGDVNAYEVASCRWCVDRIRQGGGLAILAHPHWIANVYHIPQKMLDFLFDAEIFDAFELLGGQECLSNNLQTACYQEARSRGLRVPIVGSSDSHGTGDGADWYNWFSTLVFVEELKREQTIAAVKAFYSVAVEHYPGEGTRVYGPFRLVKYALFLLESYFPLHDQLCFEEGRLMNDCVCADPQADILLGQLQGRTGALLDRVFANSGQLGPDR